VRAVVCLRLAFDSSATLPRALAHRVAFGDGSTAEGAVVRARLSVRRS
jgi:hypothetical protein